MNDYMITYIGYRKINGEDPIIINDYVETEFDEPTAPWLINISDSIKKSHHFARGAIISIMKLG